MIDQSFEGWSKLGYIVRAIDATTIGFPSLLSNTDVVNGHGTNMAIVLHEIAPEAQIFLINVGYGVGITADLLEYLIHNNIKIVSLSLGYSVCALPTYGIFIGRENNSITLDNCVRRGILVCTIAHNHQQESHFAHLRRDPITRNMIFPDGNDFIDFTALTDTFLVQIFRQRNQGNTYCISLTNLNTGDKMDYTFDNEFYTISGSATKFPKGIHINDTMRFSIQQDRNKR